ncbi:MAG TPA: hypothetical protein VF767_02610 [Bryobacteraceae bacterium]
MSKLYLLSKLFLVSTAALDLHSSVHQREMNPLYRNAQGNFSPGRGFAIKGGIAGGALLAQRLTGRKHRDAWQAFNWAMGSVQLGVAASNYGQK